MSRRISARTDQRSSALQSGNTQRLAGDDQCTPAMPVTTVGDRVIHRGRPVGLQLVLDCDGVLVTPDEVTPSGAGHTLGWWGAARSRPPVSPSPWAGSPGAVPAIGPGDTVRIGSNGLGQGHH